MVPPVLVIDSGGHTSLVKKVLFTPDGRELISVSDDNTIRFWDVASGEPIRALRPPIGPGGISKFGHHIFTSGGTDCTDAGPFGTYRWTVTGSTLTLTVIHEGCRGRGALWEGTSHGR